MSFIMIINTDFIPFNLIYPVGSIYMSTVSTNPSSYFGGTWERIEGKFLLGANSTYTAGSTGGEAAHKLEYNELPSELLTGYCTDNQKSWSTGYWANNSGAAYCTNVIRLSGKGWTGNQSHNNMHPYLTVYIWKRTA